jgi:hypothetical protein
VQHYRNKVHDCSKIWLGVTGQTRRTAKLSVQTMERYLGCKQNLRQAVNDRIGLEPA